MKNCFISRIFNIFRVAIIIKLVVMINFEGKQTIDTTQKIILPHFKSTNILETTYSKKLKMKRDFSTNSHYLTPQKNSIIANNILTNNMISSKSLIDTNLPIISSKHRSQKRSSFLEMWLDEALDPQQLSKDNQKSQKHVEVQKTGPLRTVQKFQIDKKYLKSQNIAGETIQKLYNSLYVYTYGINNTFEEILSLTKLNEHAEKKIINNFWKAFVRLLEGCTSYRTTFQVIEETYQKQIVQLKEAFRCRQEQFQKEQHIHDEEVAKFNKKINQQSYALGKLASDYNISEATLNLTDQAFNQEVNLRLKFEEKINAMFNSYDEIKTKYEKLLADLNLRDEEGSESKKVSIFLKSELQKTMIRLNELANKLARNQEILIERDKQLEEKRQQIFDLHAAMAVLNEKKDQDQQQVKKIISKANSYRRRSEQFHCEINTQNLLCEQLKKRLKQQERIIEEARDSNERIYEKYQACGKQLGTLEGENIYLSSKAQTACSEALIFRASYEEMKVAKEDAEFRMDQIENKLILTENQLKIKGSCLDKNTQLISNLQAVKNKFQNLYAITLAEKKRMEGDMNEALRLKQIFEEEMKGMKMLLQNRTIELEQANSKLNNQREVFRSKISSLKQEIQCKEKQILIFHEKQLQDQQFVTKAEKQKLEIQEQNTELIITKLKLEGELSQLRMHAEEGNHERTNNRTSLRQLNERIEEIQKQKAICEANLNNKDYVISMIKGKKDTESMQLRRLLENYRDDKERKTSYIHPMIYEDLREQVNRSFIKIRQMTQMEQDHLQRQEKLNILLQEETCSNTILKASLIKSEELGMIQRKMVSEIQTERRQVEGKLNGKLKNLNEKLKAVQSRQLQLQGHSQAQQKQIQMLRKEIQYSKISEKQLKYYQIKLQDQIKIQNLHFKTQERELETFIAQNAKLKQEIVQSKRTVSKNSSRTGPRTKRLTSLEKEGLNLQVSLTPQDETIVEQILSYQQTEMKEKQIKRGETTKKSRQQKYIQTEKPTFSHKSKFQVNSNQQGIQVNIGSAPQLSQLLQISSGRPQRDQKRVEGGEFKRALKITYMRR